MRISLKKLRERPVLHRFGLLVFISLGLLSSPAGGERVLDLEKYSLISELNTERDIERYAVKRVQPDYPMLAQKHKIEGIVIVEVKVSGEGRVTGAQFVNGHNVFRSVSLDAAKQWEFKRGSGIEGTIRFTFKLK